MPATPKPLPPALDVATLLPSGAGAASMLHQAGRGSRSGRGTASAAGAAGKTPERPVGEKFDGVGHGPQGRLERVGLGPAPEIAAVRLTFEAGVRERDAGVAAQSVEVGLRGRPAIREREEHLQLRARRLSAPSKITAAAAGSRAAR